MLASQSSLCQVLGSMKDPVSKDKVEIDSGRCPVSISDLHKHTHSHRHRMQTLHTSVHVHAHSHTRQLSSSDQGTATTATWVTYQHGWKQDGD